MIDERYPAVLEALDDPKWEWRTLDGIARSANITRDEALRIIVEHPAEIESFDSQEHGMIFRLRHRKNPVHTPLIEKALDYMSMGRRRRIA